MPNPLWGRGDERPATKITLAAARPIARKDKNNHEQVCWRNRSRDNLHPLYDF